MACFLVPYYSNEKKNRSQLLKSNVNVFVEKSCCMLNLNTYILTRQQLVPKVLWGDRNIATKNLPFIVMTSVWKRDSWSYPDIHSPIHSKEKSMILSSGLLHRPSSGNVISMSLPTKLLEIRKMVFSYLKMWTVSKFAQTHQPSM